MPKILDNKYSVKQYAEKTGKNKQTIFKQIWEKRLPKGVKAQKIGNSYLIIDNSDKYKCLCENCKKNLKEQKGDQEKN